MSTAPAAGDWCAFLKPWLTSGHARHIAFRYGYRGNGDIAALSRTLATTFSLRGLTIWGADELLRALVSLKLPLHQYTEIDIATSGAKTLRLLLKRLDIATLTSLKLACDTDHADTLRLVGHMPSLRHLALTDGCVGNAFADASTWPALESIAFERVSLAATARRALFAYFHRVQGLRAVTLEGPKCIGTTDFFDWSLAFSRLLANGLVVAKLVNTGLDDACAALLARALREVRNTSSLHLDLTENDISIDGVGALLNVLATCLYVRIEIACMSFDLFAPYTTDIQAFAAIHGMTATVTDEHFTLCSPSTRL